MSGKARYGYYLCMKPPDRYLRRATFLNEIKRRGCVETYYVTVTDQGQPRNYIRTIREGRGCETWKVWRKRG